MRELVALELKAFPCNGALLGMCRTIRTAWDEPTCQLVPHDDDVDCLYSGPFEAWQGADWRRINCVFTDRRADTSVRAGECCTNA